MTSRIARRSTGPDASDAGPDAERSRRLAIRAVIACLIPVLFKVGSLTLSPSRLIFLVSVPILLAGLLAGRLGKFRLIDLFVFLNIGWMVISIFVNDPGNAVTFAGLNGTMILGGYLVGRAGVRNIADFQRLSKLLCIAVLFSAPFALAETRNGTMHLAELLGKLPGLIPVENTLNTPRFGLNRVQFVFEHPIHYGLFCTMAAALTFIGLRSVIGWTQRMIATAVIVGCCFLSVSSGPFLALMVQILLIGWMIAMRRVPRRWPLLIGLTSALYLVLELLSNRPAIIAIVTELSFNPATANARRVLFEYGIRQIGRTPLFGAGFERWELPTWLSGSVDNFWLLLALIYGIPAFVGLFGAMLLALIGISTRPARPGSAYDDARQAWCITMVSLTLTLATVAIWSEIMALFYLLFGAGVWMLDGDPDLRRDPAVAAPAPAKGAAAAPQSRGPRFTRFDQRKTRDQDAP